MIKNKPSLNRSKRDFLATTAHIGLLSCALPLPVFAASTNANKKILDQEISYIGIYPPIGISRVGSASVEHAFYSPEVPGFPPEPIGGFKDGTSKIKKQAQRFYLYGFNQSGEVVKEITAEDADIDWKVRVANTKAAWYGFNNPFNLGPEVPGIPAKIRNQGVRSIAEREKRLVIDSGEIGINGKNINRAAKSEQYKLVGSFWREEIKVSLGDLATDDAGRLIFIPANGVSAPVIPNNPIVDFTKNDAWYDDWCDGSVNASITLRNGKKLHALPAWIVSCGPDYAPDITPFTTMYDSILNNLVKKYSDWDETALKKVAQPPKRPALPLSFARDVYPLFHRMAQMEWVSSAAHLQAGWIDIPNFSDQTFIGKLATKDNQALRQKVFSAFRNPSSTVEEKFRLPFMLGGGVDFEGVNSHWFQMTSLQYWILTKWNEGNFIDDWQQFLSQSLDRHIKHQNISDLPLQDQPAALTRAALEPLSGGNFHPGVELTWILERPELFDDLHPFRIAVGNRALLAQNLGPLITPQNTFPETSDKNNRHHSLNASPQQSPIGPQMPGDLTRWMGLPWQPDAFSCQNVNYPHDYPTVVWWPANLPVDVLPEYAYQRIIREDLSREDRLKFASVRAAWSRGAAGVGYHANGSYFDGLNRAIYLWERLGFIVKKPTPKALTTGPGALPEFLYVETERGSMEI
ncbi:CTQ-dependent glycine oxidase GoxA [Zwartia sp.]|uniref:CTQ-dependent glycine oxidase GoxA n=1 Tax=Zwartia sp. TaxID=2978004 RepID=UPI0027290A86|nr:CTQ-dependent glycine oxidase GoxA [Zwartia sp.]MDO9025091.1 CTQ-dependent glycine oxidase GoxA [Zwartia sp.]